MSIAKRFASLATALVVLAALLGASQVLGQNAPVLERIVESGKLRVGTSGTQPPFSVKSKDGKLIGYEIDIATLVARAMGVELVLVEKPFGDLLDALDAGEVDVVMSGMTMTPARNLRAAFIGPYMVSGKSILTKSSTLAAISEVDQINRASLKVAALRGSTSEGFVRQVAPDVQLVLAEDYDAAIQQVIDGSIDALVADFPICALSVLRHPDAGLTTLAEPLTIEPIGVAVSSGDSLLLNMMENYLGALEAVGVLEELQQRWFDDGSWLIQVP